MRLTLERRTPAGIHPMLDSRGDIEQRSRSPVRIFAALLPMFLATDLRRFSVDGELMLPHRSGYRPLAAHRRRKLKRSRKPSSNRGRIKHPPRARRR
jgi:hypothetical protein